MTWRPETYAYEQQDLLGVDTRPREVQRVELPVIDLTKYKPGMSVRTNRILVACPTCKRTGALQPKSAMDDKKHKRRVVHYLHPNADNTTYANRTWCEVWPTDAEAAAKAAQSIVDGVKR